MCVLVCRCLCVCVCVLVNALVHRVDTHVMPADYYNVAIAYQGTDPITLTTLQQSSTGRHRNRNH